MKKGNSLDPSRAALASVVMLSLLSGCFAGALGVGNQFTWEQVDALTLGMTKEQVIETMGSDPAGVKATTTDDGQTREELGWVDVDTLNWKSITAIFVDGHLVEITRETGP